MAPPHMYYKGTQSGSIPFGRSSMIMSTANDLTRAELGFYHQTVIPNKIEITSVRKPRLT